MLTFRRAYVAFFLILGLATLTVPARGASSDDMFWDDFFASHRPNQFVDAILVDGNDLYVAGNFDHVGDTQALCVARWDGENWTRLGSGIGTLVMGLVHTLAKSGDKLYAGGMFDTVGPRNANNIAVYDLKYGTWSSVGEGTDRAVRCISVANNGNVFVTGEFTTADGLTARGVAMWNGLQWYTLGGGFNPRARGISVLTVGDVVYVGGYFSMAGGSVPVHNVALYENGQWKDLGGGVNDLVTAMAYHNGSLYVAGNFSKAGGLTARSIARWDGRSWKPLGDGLSGPGVTSVRALTPIGGELYAGGTFNYAGGEPANHIARWDGANWNPLGSGASDEIKVIRQFRGLFYVGGDFTSIGGQDAGYLVRWTMPATGALSVSRFEAESADGAVALSWEVGGTETPQGFRVYRREVSSDEEVLVTAATLDGAAAGYTDRSAGVERDYDYQLAIVRDGGVEFRSGPVRVHVKANEVMLEQNAPNPFNPTTTISFVLPAAADVTLAVYDVTGRLVRVLEKASLPGGSYARSWDGRDERGNTVATGLYLYRLDTPQQTLSKKMLLLK